MPYALHVQSLIKFLSILTRKHLVDTTCFSFVLDKERFILPSRAAILFLNPINIKHLSFKLTVHLLTLSQMVIF